MSELTEQNLTRQQAEQEMACLRKIYASVRLLDPKMLAEEPCYPPWKNIHPCTSCVGREAMAGKMPVLQAGNAWQFPLSGHSPLCRGGRQALCDGDDPAAGRQRPQLPPLQRAHLPGRPHRCLQPPFL